MKIDQSHYDGESASTAEKVTLLVLGGAFFFMMTMEMLSNYEPRKLAIVFFALAWMPLVLLHELGHAIVANILGWKVEKTVVGFGKVLTTWRLFGAPLEFRMVPLEGFVQMRPLQTPSNRFSHALIFFAGPGIELLLFFVIFIFLGGADIFTIEDDYIRLILQSIAFAALAGAVLNLVPMGIISKDGETPNDGMGILMCLFQSEKNYRKWMGEGDDAHP